MNICAYKPVKIYDESGINERFSTLFKNVCYLLSTASGGGIQSIVAGTNISVDDTDPLNPIISATGGSGFSAVGGTLSGTGGLGFFGVLAQSSAPSTPASGIRLYANSSNALSWIGQNGFTRTLDGTSNTANRTYTLPDASVTIAGLSNTQSFTGANTFANTTNGTANVIFTGTVPGVSDNVGVLVNGTITGTTNAHPFRIAPTYSPTANGLAVAAIDIPIATGGTSNLDHVVGVQNLAAHASSGTLTNMYNTYFGYTTTGGTTTNRYGSHVIDKTGAGTLTNQYGYYSAALTGGATLNYAFYSAGTTKNYFGGPLEQNNNVSINFGLNTSGTKTLDIKNKSGEDATIRLQQSGQNYWDFRVATASTSLVIQDVNNTAYAAFLTGGNCGFGPTPTNATSKLHALGSFAAAYAAKSASYNLNSNDYCVTMNCTTGAFTATLPTAVGITGRIYVIKKSDNSVNNLTIATTSSQTIDGVTTKTLTTQYSGYTLMSDGANWMIIGTF